MGHDTRGPKRGKREGQNQKESDYGNNLEDVTRLPRKPAAIRSPSTLVEAIHVPAALCCFPACCSHGCDACKCWTTILPALWSTLLGPDDTCSHLCALKEGSMEALLPAPACLLLGIGCAPSGMDSEASFLIPLHEGRS